MKRTLIIGNTLCTSHSLKMLLNECGFEVAGETVIGLTALRLYNELKPDLVVISVGMQESENIKALSIIKNIGKKTKMVIFSQIRREYLIKEAIAASAAAFIIVS